MATFNSIVDKEERVIQIMPQTAEWEMVMPDGQRGFCKLVGACLTNKGNIFPLYSDEWGDYWIYDSRTERDSHRNLHGENRPQ